ncbi:MAG TPA: DUF883 family protein [Burkholderiales bacterium]|nr:DUF883 family protein [Burkholderiales bacterium]
MDNINTDRIIKDMRSVIVDAEDLLKATASQTGERIEKARARAEESLRVARERMKDVGMDLDAQMRENPWATAGIAAGVGLLLGLLIGRR